MQVILCERGIRSAEPWTRNTLIYLQWLWLKVIPPASSVDPSHATGVRSLVTPMAKAAIAAGADGIMVEVHPHPEKALSDGEQSLTPRGFSQLMKAIEPVARAIGRGVR